jgi:hypothetical protein
MGSDRLVCDRFQAAYLSPSPSDSTIGRFRLQNADSKSRGFLVQLIRGEAATLETEHLSTMVSVCADLGNDELKEQMMENATIGELTVSNCIERFRLTSHFRISNRPEAAFIARHFFELPLDSLKALECSEIEHVVDSAELCIESEDKLLSFLIGLGSDYASLLGHVRLEFLRPDSIDNLFNNLPFESVDSRIWSGIWRRCRHQLVYEADEVPKKRFHESFVTLEAPPDGLIHRLTELSGGNVHERGLVEISCSTTTINNCWQVADANWDGYWSSGNVPNSWIQFDFKNRQVSIKCSALKPHRGTTNFPVRWTLAGSRDGEAWEVIDMRNTQELVGTHKRMTFQCVEPSNAPRFYRYVRLTQTGDTSSGHCHLILANVEFFGCIIDKAESSAH